MCQTKNDMTIKKVAMEDVVTPGQLPKELCADDKTKVSTCVPLEGKSTTPSSTSAAVELPGVLEYVHMKYGTPYSQLKVLSESGHFKTNAVDTSGKGLGPTIKCPIESQVCLPTPSHAQLKKVGRKKATLGGMPLPASIDSTSLMGPELHIAKTDMDLKCSGKLEFESRFESGNLWKTSQV